MSDSPPLKLHGEVLVIGGGLAATWAAVTAAEAGASVVLVDKGYCGASGVAATAGVGHWLVPPERQQLGLYRQRVGSTSAPAVMPSDDEFMSIIASLPRRAT